MRSENIQDISSLGGNPVFIASAILFWLFGSAGVTYQLAVSLILCYVATTILRIAFFKQRPLKQQYKNFLERIDATSFPSLHSMRAAALATTIGLFFSQPLVWLLVIITVIAVATARVMLKRHYAVDVIAGMLLGIALAFLSPLILNWVL